MAVTRSNANAALVFELLGKLVGLGRAYFGTFGEDSVKANFVCVYELLDGMLRMFYLGFGGVWGGG